MNLKLLSVAKGETPADLVIRNGKIVNVYSGEIYEGGVAVCGDTIAAVGDVDYCVGENTRVVDAEGKYLTPGFLDGHIHPESSSLAIRSFAEAVLSHGTTGIMTDLHEVGVVSGLEGIEAILKEAETTDLKLYFVVPSHVPFSPNLETSGGRFNPEIIRRALRRPDAVGLSECVGPYIMAGFPDLIGIPYQLFAVFLVSEIDQLTCVPYIDAVESFGLPADCCPVPSSECGALVLDALPHMGKCFISSSMPCDGSTMASSYMSRRFPDLPVFHLCFPVRYEDEETVQCAAEDIKACIKFIEEQTGAKWSWDAYFSAMKRFNTETSYELEKWAVNQTAYPQIIGPCYELFRKWNYEMDGGIDPRILKTFKKVNKIMLKAYERKEEAWPGKMKYRAIVWSCPAHYYANFSNWLANCWGVNVLVEMESLNFTKQLETEDKEEALRDLGRLYERMVMRRHTNGGYQHVVDELWKQCEIWNVDLIIMYQNVACKNMATVQGILDDQAREQNRKMIWIEHDLMDPRTVSRRQMRDKVSEYMRTVIGASPVDPSLLEFEDDSCM